MKLKIFCRFEAVWKNIHEARKNDDGHFSQVKRVWESLKRGERRCSGWGTDFPYGGVSYIYFYSVIRKKICRRTVSWSLTRLQNCWRLCRITLKIVEWGHFTSSAQMLQKTINAQKLMMCFVKNWYEMNIF